jgi:hypothetical protein
MNLKQNIPKINGARIVKTMDRSLKVNRFFSVKRRLPSN